MRSTFLISALCGLAIAAPKGEDFEKRTACVTEPNGAGPVPGDGSVAAYYDATNLLSTTAQAAQAPSGYTESFKNLNGSTEQIGYLTYKVLPGQKYNVDACASFCNSVKFCLGFNIYYERDPEKDPAAGCPNPKAVTNIKCSLYGYPVATRSATNKGQYRGPQDANKESFHVVIVGSNGYSKIPVPAPNANTNFTGPTALPGSINAPLDNGVDTYIGMKTYSGSYDPSKCAAACQTQTAYDRATAASDGTYKPCNFFVSYIQTKNNVPQGTYCSFYTRTWDSSYAVNTGYYYGSDVYSIVGSYSFALSTPDSGRIQ